MRVSIYILTFVLAVLSIDASAQVDRREVRKGNRDFKKENYREADVEYRKALVKDSLSMAAHYNLANTLYRQNDFEQSAKAMEKLKEVAPASEYAADYYYNLGDIAIASKNWQAAVDALKQSLLRNPGDLDAKENYIYAKKMLENQQQQQQNQQNDQNQDQNDQDQNDDQQNDQNQDQNQNDQDKQDDQNQNDQNQDQNDQNRNQQNGQQPKITPQAAQQMLQAIQAKEKETQEKVKKEKAKALSSRQKEKNW